MKKILSYLLITFFILSLLGCSKQSNDNVTKQTSSSTETAKSETAKVSEVVKTNEINNANKNIDDIIVYLKQKGLNVSNKSQKSFDMLGATDGWGITVDGVEVEIYKFDKTKLNDVGKKVFEEVKSKGTLTFSGITVEAYVNDSLVLVGADTNPSKDKLIKFFKDFK